MTGIYRQNLKGRLDEMKKYELKKCSAEFAWKERKEIKEELVNYSIAKYKIFDKKVISRIDPTICDVLAQFAAKYDYEEAQLIYDYAMSYSNNVEAEWDNIPSITYNFSYFENANLSKKDKKVIERICKNARKNMNIDVKKVKIIVTVPVENVEEVRNAICSEGAGIPYGCRFWTDFFRRALPYRFRVHPHNGLPFSLLLPPEPFLLR